MLRAMDNPVLLEAGKQMLASKSSQLDTWDGFVQYLFVEGHRHVGCGWLKWITKWAVDLGDSMSTLLKECEDALPQLGMCPSSHHHVTVLSHYPTRDFTKEAPTLPYGRHGYNGSTYNLTNPNNGCV
jgi:hypothetical protein